LRYTERQQHCLESMGLVAWVSREDEYVDAYADTTADVSAHDSNTSSTPVSPTVAPDSSCTEWVEPPKDVTELAAWLPAQMLSPVSSAAQSLFYAGIETAPLLIIEEADNSNQLAGPVGMSADGAKLFELMMRAISVPTTRRKLCLLASNALAAGSLVDGSAAKACVQEMIYPDTRAVLYLSRRWDSISHCSTSEHHCRLVQSLLPTWRIPHPDILLQRRRRRDSRLRP